MDKNEVSVISSNMDGAELKRYKKDNPRYIMASGSHDEIVINEAIANRFHKSQFSIPASIWERIFGNKHV